VFSYLIHLREKKTDSCEIQSLKKKRLGQQTYIKKKNEINHNLSSLAILLAIFLKPIDVPDIRLNRTPFNDRRGNLHTSISHDTTESVFGSPCTQSKRNFSRCS
jgi:hypothetical protein